MNFLRRVFGKKSDLPDQKQLAEKTVRSTSAGAPSPSPALQAILQELFQPARITDMPRRVQLCEAALTQIDRTQNPSLWAALHNELGNSLAQNRQGPRAENVERAIAGYEQALQVMTRQAMPVDWAQTTSNLANAYSNRIRGEWAENLERAIELNEQALQVMTRQAMPVDWAQTTSNLANAYRNRIRGERAENLERAIELNEQALQVRTRQAMPVEWAQTTSNLANAYSDRIRGERAENLERAIELNEQALQVRTRQAMPGEWAETTMNLATAYSNRIRGERAENVERAIAGYEQALQVMTHQAMPVEWATTTMNLANAYSDRIRGERAENLERAIELNEQALQVRTRQAMPGEWATTTMNLAIAYRNRIRGERVENLERAIAGYEQALQVITRQAMPVEWAQTTMNLAIAYSDRIRGEQAENLERAIELNEQALAHVYQLETFPDEHRRVQNRLGDLYFQQGAWAAAANAFAAVLQAGENLYQTAATPEARQGELGKWQGVPVQLAYALLKSAPLDAAAYPEAALALERNRARWLSESLAVRTAKPTGVPDTLWQRFVALGQQIQTFQTESRLPEATPAKRPYLVLTDLLRTAYAQLEETIAQMRTSAPDFMPQPSFADIQAAARIAPLVYLLTTDAGGLALIVQTDKVTPVWLDGFTEEKLRKNLIEWFDAYEQQHTARQTWLTTMDRITRALWDEVMGPVAAALADLTTPATRSVTLIPTGLLSLLPLHAAWTDKVAGASEMLLPSRRYFLDEYMVAYAPSAAALRHAQARAQTATMGRLLAIDEPRPVQGNALPNSAREVAAVADHFAQPQILAHLTATRQAALAALAGDVFAGGVDVAHFSCHGGNDWQNPLESGLLMAHDEMLTVRDLLELQLPGARLATLSACETGIVGTNLPDEVVALPSALVQAGFAGVVASLWSVADISTAMLMARFYDFWQKEKMQPAQALRAAQRWVRDTTNREKANHFDQAMLDASSATRMPEIVAADFFSAVMIHKEGQDARSFAHPYWWAAFYLTGV